jgi:hypothetical protein
MLVKVYSVTEVLAFSGKIHIYVFRYVNNLDLGHVKAFLPLNANGAVFAQLVIKIRKSPLFI